MIVHAPKAEEDWRELKKKVATVHADMVNYRLRKLACPAEQKTALRDALIASAKKEMESPCG